MWANITTSIAKTFDAFTTLANAANSGAKAIENLCIVAEETSASYVDDARNDREVKQIERRSAYEEAKAKALAKRAALKLEAPTDVEAK